MTTPICKKEFNTKTLADSLQLKFQKFISLTCISGGVVRRSDPGIPAHLEPSPESQYADITEWASEVENFTEHLIEQYVSIHVHVLNPSTNVLTRTGEKLTKKCVKKILPHTISFPDGG